MLPKISFFTQLRFVLHHTSNYKSLNMGKKAIILGATGLVGNELLQLLLKNDSFSKIKLFSRNSCGIKDPKIEEHLINLFKLEDYKKAFTADVVFCCVGTTKAKTPNKSLYKSIDYGIPVSAASIAKENAINNFIVISSLGADVNSSAFYTKTKGHMEAAVLKLNIEKTYILRPSLLGGKRKEWRLGEYIGKLLMTLINPFLLGGLKKYRMIAPKIVASCMVFLAERGFHKKVILSNEIEEITHFI